MSGKKKDVSKSPAVPALTPSLFPIVGIGASAGGLAAFESFFSGMPEGAGSGMAFVLVQHLSPDHTSLLAELVQGYTPMPVREVEDGMEVKPDSVYIIPPNRDMTIRGGVLRIEELPKEPGARHSIDHFLGSLARDRRDRAIGVILSGMGSDGTVGARAIKNEGGLVLAQDPVSAECDSMPQSIITAGLADIVLAPEAMPAALRAHAAQGHSDQSTALDSPRQPISRDIISAICGVLRAHTAHDFSRYKETTLTRRIERRMAVHRIESPEDYLRYLRETTIEADALFGDLLINVTSFFRDPEAFAFLETAGIPRLFEGRPAGSTIRAWVCGCSTGEEAYSIAILLLELVQKLKQPYRVQIFATDIDRPSVEHARAGVYGPGIENDVTPDRLARVFVKNPETGSYRVRKCVRDLLLFSEQDVIKDPPFSRLDLVSCRNLLIYMNGDLQKAVIPLFHYALRPEGLLLLGSSEHAGEFPTLFTALDHKAKLFVRRPNLPGADRNQRERLRFPASSAAPLVRPDRRDLPDPDRDGLGALIAEVLLRESTQVVILVNRRGDILHIHGRSGRYLEPTPGEAEMNVLGMAREGLRGDLTTALHQAVTRHETVVREGLTVTTDGEPLAARLSVIPAARGARAGDDGILETVLDDPAGLYLVVLEENAREGRGRVVAGGAAPGAEVAERIAVLEQELRVRDDRLQMLIEEMETSQEELTSTNEEMQSVNEELQSANEELETSREEMQSINTELQAKLSDLSRANNDMNNLLTGTGVGTVFVDHDLRISRFTPAATQIINLIPGDVGRPIAHMAANLKDYDHLVADVRKVLDTLVPVEAEVQTAEGAWHLVRVQPYRTLENVIEGAVITFVEISERKRMEKSLQEAALREAALRDAQKSFFESIVTTVREPFLVLDATLSVVSANRAFFQAFHVEPAKTVGCLIFELGNHQWDIPALRRLLEEMLPGGSSFEDFEVTHDFESIGRRRMLLNARRIVSDADDARYILLSIEDVTGHGDHAVPDVDARPETAS